MQLRQLQYFVTTVTEGGLKTAAAQLDVTRPTLLRHIKQLERDLGVSLFHTGTDERGLTEAGRVLFRHAREVLKAAQRATCATEELVNGRVSGEIRVGTMDSVGIYFLPGVLRSIRERYPGVRLIVLYRDSNEIMEMLLSDQIDVALVANPYPDRRLRLETIVEERFSLVCGHTHPLFGKDAIKPKEIEGLRFVLLSSNRSTGRVVQDYLARLGVWVVPVASTDNIQTARKMAETGLGVTFLPDMVTSSDVTCQGKSLGRLARIRVNPPCNRRIVMATWKRAGMSRSIGAFVEEMRTYASHWKSCLEAPATGGGVPIRPLRETDIH